MRTLFLFAAVLLASACQSVPPEPAAPIVTPAAATPAKPKLLGWNPPCQPSRPNPPVPNDPIVSVVQPAANRVIERARAEPGFGGAWFENEPCYRLVLAFTDGQPRPSIIEAAEPWFRPYLGFSRSRFTEAERDQARLEMGPLIKAAGVGDAVFVDHGASPERLGIGVLTEADAARVRAVIPDRYRSLIEVWVGDIYPKLERG